MTEAETTALPQKTFLWRKLLPQSLLGRTLLILGLPLVLLQIVSAIIFYDRHWHTISRRFADSTMADIQLILHAHAQTSGDLETGGWLDLARDSLRMQIIQLPDGRLPDRPSIGDQNIIDLLSRGCERIGHPCWINAEGRDNDVEIQLKVDPGIWKVLVHKKRLRSVTTDIFILWMVGSSLILFIIATLFMNGQIRSIRRLAEAADCFGKGINPPHVPESGATEIRIASKAFKQMQSRIKKQIQQRTDMLAGVSHDLGTILTRMKLALAMTEENARIRDLKNDVAEMVQMIDGYLAFARGEGDEKTVTVSLKELITTITQNAKRRNIEIRVVEWADILLPLKEKSIRRAIINLVDNANHYAKTIEIRLRASKDTVEIIIDDDGPGILPERRQDVFKPFYRIDNARNLDSVNVGLGLTIARDNARAHGGDIHLGESPLGGLRATLKLPF